MVTPENNNKNFKINYVVFAKVKVYDDWAAKVIDIDTKSFKYTAKYKECFFKTKKINSPSNVVEHQRQYYIKIL